MTIVRHPVYGGVDVFFGDCPDVVTPPAGTVCFEQYILLYRGYTTIGGGSVAPAHAPWHFYTEYYRTEFPGDDGIPIGTLLGVAYGEVQGSVSVDQVHLRVANASVTLPKVDGTTATFSGAWTATSGRFLFGNDGPSTGRAHHVVSRCSTLVAIGHQKFVYASMTGTFGGEPVRSYTSIPSGAIFNNNFRYLDIQHGGGCP